MSPLSKVLVFCSVSFAVAVLGAGCGGDNASEPDRDTTPPAAVTDLRVEATGCDNANLAWTAPGDDGTEGKASFYDVRYSTQTITTANWASATQSQGEPAPKTSGETEHFAVSGLAAGTTYYFAVAAGDDRGNGSDLSNNASTSAVGSTDVDWVYDGLGADIDWSTSSTSLSANWAGGCVSEYEYALGTSAGGTGVIDWSSSGVQNQITRNDLNLVEGTTYYWSVRGVLGTVPGSPASSDGITVDATAPTSAVSQLPAEVGTTTFTVTWTGSDAGSGIEQFDIQVSSDGGSSWVGWLTGTTLTSSGYTGLNGHTYHFRSRAHDNAGNVEAYPATPDAHTTVNLSTSIAWVNDGLGLDEDWSLSASSLSANWEEAAYADEYEYALGTTAGGTEVVGWTSTGVVTHVTRVGLTLVDGGTYYFSVRSVYQGTPGTATTSDGITVDATAPASAVSPLAAEVGTETFTVTWSGSDAVSGIKHYNVQVSSDGGSSWGSWLTGTVLTSSDFPGVNGTTYYFRSRAHDIAGNVEDYPSVADAHTTVNLAAGLQVAWVRDGLTLGNDDDWTNQSATLYAHWEAVAGADGYEAAIGTSPGGTDIMDWYLVYMTSIATCTLPLVNGGTYYYSVRVVVGASHGAAVSSDGITLDTGLPSSSVQALPAVTSNISFTVSWSGTDALSGVNAYDVQVKDGGGEWQDWLVGTGLTQSAFYAEVDHTYYFRSRAADGAANFEAYPTEADAQTCVTCTFAYERDWGQEGTGPGDFKLPFNVAVDGLGRVYVAESDNARVQVFDPSGTLLRQIGSHGFVDSLLWQAAGVAIDDSGYVYVTDFNADKVKKYTSEGAFVLAWGGSGSGENQMDYPRGITVDDSFYVYVAEQGNDRVHKFTSGGVSVKTWGGYGTADGQFRGCMSVAVSPSGDIYALDQNNHRIQQFTSDGVFVRKWGSYGSADGQFSSIDFIAVDASGHVYVTQQGDCRIQRFTPEGVFLNKWGGCGSGDGQFLDEPFGIAVGADGTVYVTDLSACRVVKFTATCP